MARAALTPELKTVRALSEMWNQRDYTRYHLAQMLVSGPMDMDSIQLAVAIIEMAAVRADSGDFDKDNHEWILAARSMRNAFVKHLDSEAVRG